jgi:hypothetical protein
MTDNLFALCFNNHLSPHKYSQLIHSVQPLIPVPFNCAVPYILYCAVDLITPVCCIKHCYQYPLLRPSLYGDHMLRLHRWIISPKIYLPYKHFLTAACPIRHCVGMSISLNMCPSRFLFAKIH